MRISGLMRSGLPAKVEVAEYGEWPGPGGLSGRICHQPHTCAGQPVEIGVGGGTEIADAVRRGKTRGVEQYAGASFHRDHPILFSSAPEGAAKEA